MTTTLLTITDPEIPTEITQDVIGSFTELASRLSSVGQTATDILRKNPDSDDVATEARDCRLQMVRVRTDTERTRKELLKPIDLRRKAINGAAAIFEDKASQIEAQLRPIEDAAETRKEERRRQLHDDRLTEISVFLQGDLLTPYSLMDLGSKSNKDFLDIVNSAKSTAESLAAKKAEEELARMEEERVAAELEAQRQVELAEAQRVAAELEAQRQVELAVAQRVSAELAELRAQVEIAKRKESAEREAREIAAAKQREAEAAEHRRKVEADIAEALAVKQLALAPDREKLTLFLYSVSVEIDKLVPSSLTTPTGKTTMSIVSSILQKSVREAESVVNSMK
jgi:hypothetical protein